MKKLCLMMLSVALCAGFTACGDDDPQSPDEPIVSPDEPDDPDEPDEPDQPDDPEQKYTLYATGYSDVLLYGFWWKTGDTALTSVGNSNESIETNAIAVTDDGSVYIGGTMTSDALGGYEVAALWKNGQLTMLTDMARPTDAAVYGLAVDGNDVWAAGFYRYLRDNGWSFQRDAAMLWKNGNKIELTNGETYAKAWDVDISGNNVYVAGEKSNADGFAVATVWKGDKNSTDWSNCEEISLTDGLSHAYAEGICADGDDVYAVGYKNYDSDKKVACIWKNGVETVLSTNESYATSVCVNGDKVYVAGWEYIDINGRKCAVATLWENGVTRHLYNEPHSSQARCVVSKGDYVYVSGFIGNQAVIWENGVAGALANDTYPTCITSLFLK